MLTTGKLSRSLATILGVVAVVIAIQAWRVSHGARLPPESQRPGLTPPGGSGDATDNGLIPAAQWTVFRSEGHTPVGSRLSERLRLAGTYPVMGTLDARGEHQWRAILDDLERNRQDVFKVNDTFELYTITRISAGMVVLEGEGEQVVLTPGSRYLNQSRDIAAGLTPDMSPAMQEFISSTNRFGRQIAEHRWEISRERLLEYVDEVKGDMLRVAALYSSLMPDYSEDRDILGYVLDMTGENDFFEAIGMRNGDIVRKVNSMSMISQRRAEYFISEFMNDNLPTVVIDVERDDEMIKLIYLMDGTFVEAPANEDRASEPEASEPLR